jgi:imidazole glycerol-phosphate synthase subunit HisH
VVIQVVNFPFCNFYSLERFLRVESHEFRVLSVADSVSVSDTVLLPGVGTFRQGMEHLHETGLESMLLRHASAGGRVIGICLGMQILLDASSESPGVEGLGLIPGVCERIPADPSFSVPHIGWNPLVLPDFLHASVRQLGMPSSVSFSDFYFVHSFVAKPSVADAIIASFEHPSGHLAAAISLGSVIGFQFHPEKSGSAGYRLLNHVLAP